MKLYLAPIKGITDYIYRDAFAHHLGGFDVAVTPFISSVMGRKIKASLVRDILPANNRNCSIIPQILSKDPDDFLYLAEEIFSLGYTEINWNIGCPSPMVANKRRGSGLLPFPELIDKILNKLCGKFPGMISVKTRLGRYDSFEIEALMPILNRYPLRKLIIHPRLGVQMYKGEVDLKGFAKCAKVCTHKLIYNGDITSRDSFLKIQKQFPSVEEWMIGRGVLMNPYLAMILRGEKVSFSREVLVEFHDELFRRYGEILAGPSHQLGRMKAIWFYLAGIFTNEHQCRKLIFKTKNIDHYCDAVKNNFEEEELSLL